ncbi:MAG TPA: hypothetical protein VFK33_00440 [Bacillales bacterium]|nr:hypothetical protein [Bacillales bacterium]
MNENRYAQLTKEFEQQLKRPLDDKEKAFLKWLAEKEANTYPNSPD